MPTDNGQTCGWPLNSHTGTPVPNSGWWLSQGCVDKVSPPLVLPHLHLCSSPALRHLGPGAIRTELHKTGWEKWLGIHEGLMTSCPLLWGNPGSQQAQLRWSFVSRPSWTPEDSPSLALRIVMYNTCNTCFLSTQRKICIWCPYRQS